jgi:hypothetical protein
MRSLRDEPAYKNLVAEIGFAPLNELRTWNREPGTENYTGTGTLSTISRSTCSACSDFFRVEV